MQRRALVAALTAVVGLMAVAAAFGAGPDRFHNAFTEEDADFCGTGELVLIQGTEDVIVWIGETGGDPTQALKANIKRRITFTNPENGLTVVEQWAFTSRARVRRTHPRVRREGPQSQVQACQRPSLDTRRRLRHLPRHLRRRRRGHRLRSRVHSWAAPGLRRRPLLLDARTGARPRLIASKSGPTDAVGPLASTSPAGPPSIRATVSAARLIG